MNRLAPEVWIGDDAVAFTREGVRRVAEAARRAITARGRFLLALAGGTTPRKLYRTLAAEEHGIDWQRVVILFSDERLLPHDHPDSNYRMARETLLDAVPLSPQNIHPVPTHLPVREAAMAYEATLRGLLDPRDPRVDLILLGMGADGHTASIFPGSPLLRADDFFADNPDTGLLRAARTARSTRSYSREPLCAAVTDAPKAPAARVTMTPYFINQARQVLVLVLGEDKVAAVSAALESDADPGESPIRAISPEGGALTWLLDRRAARALTNAPR